MISPSACPHPALILTSFLNLALPCLSLFNLIWFSLYSTWWDSTCYFFPSEESLEFGGVYCFRLPVFFRVFLASIVFFRFILCLSMLHSISYIVTLSGSFVNSHK